jgi:hypothetical protein
VITAADRALESGIETVDEFFDGVFAPLDAWLPRLGEQLRQQLRGGPMSGAQLAALVEPEAHAILDASDRPLYGAGYCASESVVSEGNPLAWWQGPERSLLASSTFGPGQAAIDLVRLEWYRVPLATGERHVAGPFVDYLCSNEITITSSIPVMLDGGFAGVVCADVLVSSLEGVLLPSVAQLPEATLGRSIRGRRPRLARRLGAGGPLVALPVRARRPALAPILASDRGGDPRDRGRAAFRRAHLPAARGALGGASARVLLGFRGPTRSVRGRRLTRAPNRPTIRSCS